MCITRPVLVLIVFCGGVIPSVAGPIPLHHLLASVATHIRDVNVPTLSVNDEVSGVIDEMQSDRPIHAVGHEVSEPVSTTGSNGMLAAFARIAEPATLVLMGGGTIVLAAYLARQNKRRTGRLWDRRRSPRRGYY